MMRFLIGLVMDQKFIEMGVETGIECNTTIYCIKIGLVYGLSLKKNI